MQKSNDKSRTPKNVPVRTAVKAGRVVAVV